MAEEQEEAAFGFFNLLLVQGQNTSLSFLDTLGNRFKCAFWALPATK